MSVCDTSLHETDRQRVVRDHTDRLVLEGGKVAVLIVCLCFIRTVLTVLKKACLLLWKGRYVMHWWNLTSIESNTHYLCVFFFPWSNTKLFGTLFGDGVEWRPCQAARKRWNLRQPLNQNTERKQNPVAFWKIATRVAHLPKIHRCLLLVMATTNQLRKLGLVQQAVLP